MQDYISRECFILSHAMSLQDCRDWLQGVTNDSEVTIIHWQIVPAQYPHQNVFHQIMLRIETSERFYMMHTELFT